MVLLCVVLPSYQGAAASTVWNPVEERLDLIPIHPVYDMPKGCIPIEHLEYDAQTPVKRAHWLGYTCDFDKVFADWIPPAKSVGGLPEMSDTFYGAVVVPSPVTGRPSAVQQQSVGNSALRGGGFAPLGGGTFAGKTSRTSSGREPVTLSQHSVVPPLPVPLAPTGLLLLTALIVSASILRNRQNPFVV